MNQPHFHSNLDQYDPKMKFYESNHHELYSSMITSTPENTSSVSSVNFPMLSNDSCYDHDHNDMHRDSPLVNMEGFDDVCKWYADDDDDHHNHDHGMDDTMEMDSQVGIKNLLMAYMDAMGMGHEELAKVIVKCISKKANPNGSPLERIAFNLFQIEENHEETYLRQESLRNFNLSFRAFYDIFPYGRFAHLTAGSTIIEAVPTHVESVHIVDFDICEGCQWPPVIEAMARMKKSLIITSIKLDQDKDQNLRFEQTKRNLCNFSRSFGLNLEVQEMELAQIVKKMEGSEFVGFNCMVGLPHMGRTRKITQVMDFIKVAKEVLEKTEGIITFGDGDQGCEKTRRSSDFSSFFNKFLVRYKALYESLEWGFPSYFNEARIAMETLFLAPFVSSKSWFQKWEKQREYSVFDMNLQKGFGLNGERMSRESLNEAREMVKEGETPYRIRIEGQNENEMVLEWKGIPLVRVCAWK